MVDTITPATCQKGALTLYRCSNCSKTYQSADDTLAPHSFGTSTLCTVCGESALSFKLSDDELYYIVTGFAEGTDTSDISEIIIPSSYHGVPVKVVGEAAFENNLKLERLEIQKGIEVIEEDAFAECKNLAWIMLPKTLNTIENAFGGISQYVTIYYWGTSDEYLQIKFDSCFYGTLYYYAKTDEDLKTKDFNDQCYHWRYETGYIVTYIQAKDGGSDQWAPTLSVS